MSTKQIVKFTTAAVVFAVLGMLVLISVQHSPTHAGARVPEFHASKDAAINDAADAIDRLREFHRQDTLIEATRLFQIAERQSKDDANFTLLTDYYYAAKQAVTLGGPEYDLRAEVCGSEVRGKPSMEYVGSTKKIVWHGPGDCEKLTKKWQEDRSTAK